MNVPMQPGSAISTEVSRTIRRLTPVAVLRFGDRGDADGQWTSVMRHGEQAGVSCSAVHRCGGGWVARTGTWLQQKWLCRVVCSARSSPVRLTPRSCSMSPTAVGFLDRSPLFKGHVLVVPRIHVVDACRSWTMSGRSSKPCSVVAAAIPAALGAQGTFVAINNVVSQSVPHLHAHVVPRTRGDGLRGFFWPRFEVRAWRGGDGRCSRSRRAAVDARCKCNELSACDWRRPALT